MKSYSSSVGARWLPVAIRYLARLRSTISESASSTLAVGVGRVPSLIMKTMSFPPSRKDSRESEPIGFPIDSLITSFGGRHSTSLG